MPGWTAKVEGGSLGGPATGILWQRPTGEAGENPVLRLRIGPIPSGNKRLQFKVLQTYSNGQIDRWIEEWPAGAPEPDAPGPVLAVVGSATTTSVAAPSKPDDSHTGLIVGVLIAVLAAGGGASWWLRRRRATP